MLAKLHCEPIVATIEVDVIETVERVVAISMVGLPLPATHSSHSTCGHCIVVTEQ